jgi:hypothetical protein
MHWLMHLADAFCDQIQSPLELSSGFFYLASEAGVRLEDKTATTSNKESAVTQDRILMRSGKPTACRHPLHIVERRLGNT